MNDKREASYFLKALHEDGIQEIFIERKKPGKHPISNSSQNTHLREKKFTPDAENSDRSKVREAMIRLREQTLNCKLCPQLCSTRTKVVFGSGNVKAKLMFVGEAPGQEEDLQGLPFVGAAGQLLTKIIESIGLTRQDVFIANTLKCRPPKNRTPLPDEISNCHPFLQKQIELIRPRIICALGAFAAQTLLKTETPISRLREKFWNFQEGTQVVCTFHPAYLLRNPGEKRKVWEDMKRIKAELDRLNVLP